MSIVRLLPAWLHAIADYAVALTLIVVASAVGGSGTAVAAGVVVGAVVLVVSLLTRYPLGVLKVLPFKVHSAGDYLAAALLVASPFALGFSSSDRGLTVLYLASGAAVLGVSLITNYQYGPQRAEVTAREPMPTAGGATTPSAAPPSSPVSPSQTEPRGAESWRSEYPTTVGATAASTSPAAGPAAEAWRTTAGRPAAQAAVSRASEPVSVPVRTTTGITREQVLAEMAALQQQAA